MLKIKTILVLTSAIFFGVACSEDAKDAVQNFTNEPDLNGRYSKSCSSSELADFSYQETLKFEADATFTHIQEYYVEPDCSGSELAGRVDIQGTYKVDSDGAPNSNGGAIELKLESASVTANSDALATAMNTVSFCGSSDYSAGAEIEVSGATIDTLCPVREVPSILYGVYRETDGELYLNEDDLAGMAESAEQRPKQLDSSTPYIKQ